MSSATTNASDAGGRPFSPEQVRSVAPALDRHTQERLFGEVWNRPDLDRRDRNLITIAALIACGQTGELGYYANNALENGVKPTELSETIVHLAYYSGWGRAMAATAPVNAVFAQRGISMDELQDEAAQPLALNEAAEAQRAKNVADQFGDVAPGLVDYTTDYLFRDLWLRPDRPRSRDRGGAGCLGSGGSSDFSSQPRDGQRPHPGAGGGGRDAPCLLRRLAERDVGAPSLQGRVLQATDWKEVTGTLEFPGKLRLRG